MRALADLARLCPPSPPFDAVIRAHPSDFVVREIPAYPPSGTGEHLFVRFEKTDLTTPEAVRRLARAAGARPQDAGWAGLKDRRAVTEQWASLAGGSAADLSTAEVPGIRVLEISAHPHKLRTGHVRANCFEICVRGPSAASLPILEGRLARLCELGCPNYFGPQRFGREGSGLERAIAWLVDGARPPRDRFERKLLASTLQAAMFNQALSQRLEGGTLFTALRGDLMRKESNGGLFECENPSVEQGRIDEFEITPTGPMFGPKMRWPAAEVRAIEEKILADFGVEPEQLSSWRKFAPGTRRPLRVALADASLRPAEGAVWVRFTLPSGAYATTVLNELLGTMPSHGE